MRHAPALIALTFEFSPVFELNNFKRLKYLKECGYDPIILTNKEQRTPAEIRALSAMREQGWEIHELPCMRKTPFRIFSKFFGAYGVADFLDRFFFIPDPFITMAPAALAAIGRIVRTRPVDAMITLSPPEGMLCIGLLAKKMFRLPWIADCHDLWTTKKIVHRHPTRLHLHAARSMEKAVYRKVDHLIANTPGNREIYLSHFRVPDHKITVITNGYDPQEKRHSPVHWDDDNRNRFTLGYMGNFDKTGFPVTELLSAFKSLLAEHGAEVARMHICGPVSAATRRKFASDLPAKAIEWHGELPHREAFEITSRCDILVLLMYETPYSKAIVPHKLYHYLVMRKPILALAQEDGNVAAIIRITRTGRTVSAKSPDVVRRELAALYECRLRNCFPFFHPDDAEISRYDNRTHTEQLCAIVDRIRK
jgi:glycosyltransferase involved in cell wall biosynthesis